MLGRLAYVPTDLPPRSQREGTWGQHSERLQQKVDGCDTPVRDASHAKKSLDFAQLVTYWTITAYDAEKADRNAQ